MVDLSWLVEPYESEFMRNALQASVLVGVLAPVVGVWIVLRRLAYLGDAMSHSLLAGVALAYLAGVSITLGALVAGAVMAVLIGVLAAHPRLREDAVIGIVETALFAIGVILVSVRSDTIAVDLGAFLFGQITTVTPGELRLNAALTAGAVVTVIWLFADLKATSFDPVHARLVGVRVSLLGHAVLLLLTIAIVVSLQTVGLLMSVSMLVTPAAAARLVTTRTSTMTAVAIGVGVGVGASIVGLTVSFHLGTPPGATVALAAVAILATAFAGTIPRRVKRSHRGVPLHAWEPFDRNEPPTTTKAPGTSVVT